MDTLQRLVGIALFGGILGSAVGALALLVSDEHTMKYPKRLLFLALFLSLSPFLIRAQTLWQGSFWLHSAERQARISGLTGFMLSVWVTVLTLSMVGSVASTVRPAIAALIPPFMAAFFYCVLLPAQFWPGWGGRNIELRVVVAFCVIASFAAYACARRVRAARQPGRSSPSAAFKAPSSTR